jgi:hypothetical protein
VTVFLIIRAGREALATNNRRKNRILTVSHIRNLFIPSKIPLNVTGCQEFLLELPGKRKPRNLLRLGVLWTLSDCAGMFSGGDAGT